MPVSASIRGDKYQTDVVNLASLRDLCTRKNEALSNLALHNVIR
jgi:hypothetical protein